MTAWPTPNFAVVRFVHGGGIIVRFTDEWGKLTAFARKKQKLTERSDLVHILHKNACGLPRLMLMFKARRLARALRAIQRKIERRVIKELRHIDYECRGMEVQFDEYFRPMPKHEIHELVKLLGDGVGAQLLIYPQVL